MTFTSRQQAIYFLSKQLDCLYLMPWRDIARATAKLDPIEDADLMAETMVASLLPELQIARMDSKENLLRRKGNEKIKPIIR